MAAWSCRAAWPCLDSSLACARSLAGAWQSDLRSQQSYLFDSWEGLSLLQVPTLVFLIYCTLHYTPGDGAGEPELCPAAGPEGAVLSLALGPRAASGDVLWPVVQCLLSAWREEEQEREEGKVQDWPELEGLDMVLG